MNKRLPHGPAFRVLFEDRHLLVADKPAGMATMGAAPGQPSLVEAVREHLRRCHGSGVDPFVGVVSRLDASVTGAVVLARTSGVAAALSTQFAERSIDKTYLAIVVPGPQVPAAECEDWLLHDDRQQRVRVVAAGTTGAKPARLGYRVLRALQRGALLEVRLDTGRKHQIRVQLASRGHAIAGDAKYGSAFGFPRGIALHARSLCFTHPVENRRMSLDAPVPGCWASWGVPDSKA
ncbi:MAG: RluA family pseudouridine synthase [Planctomycetes bacterium]|nr:RluA family pseudouridine synthase [Planctomycetota bacterium]